MMTLKQIIKGYTWLNIRLKLIELYPKEDENGNLPRYEGVLEKLRSMIPEVSDVMLNITWQHDELENENYVDVSGKELNTDHSQPIVTDSCAIEFTPWSQWLGMEITENTLEYFSELEIVCHSLFEMTFVGFEEESIQNEIRRIQEIRDEYANMSEEEKEKNTRSVEDFFKELEDDDPEV